MEVGASIAKTFKRFTIPRSTSSIGSFTTSNGTASDIEVEEVTISTSSHPPISYVQNYRSNHSQQNLSRQTSRPVSEDISSYMIRSASTDFNSPTTEEYTSKKSKVNFSKDKNQQRIFSL